MARPKVDIDWEKVRVMLRAHCDGVAIAGVLGIHPDTLYLRCQEDHKMGFSEFSALKKAEGVVLMEYSIYKDALDHGGADRMFWLKNKAGWKDRQDVELGGSVRLDPFLALMKTASVKEPEIKEEKDNARVRKTTRRK
jgi:hypothetical protein